MANFLLQNLNRNSRYIVDINALDNDPNYPLISAY